MVRFLGMISLILKYLLYGENLLSTYKLLRILAEPDVQCSIQSYTECSRWLSQSYRNIKYIIFYVAILVERIYYWLGKVASYSPPSAFIWRSAAFSPSLNCNLHQDGWNLHSPLLRRAAVPRLLLRGLAPIVESFSAIRSTEWNIESWRASSSLARTPKVSRVDLWLSCPTSDHSEVMLFSVYSFCVTCSFQF